MGPLGTQYTQQSYVYGPLLHQNAYVYNTIFGTLQHESDLVGSRGAGNGNGSGRKRGEPAEEMRERVDMAKTGRVKRVCVV